MTPASGHTMIRGSLPGEGPDLTAGKLCTMTNRTLYWFPVIGIFLSLAKYEDENGMAPFWTYYQALSLMFFIAIVSVRMFMPS